MAKQRKRVPKKKTKKTAKTGEILLGWTPAEGSWTVEGESLRQSDLETATRCYRQAGVADLVADFTFRLDESGRSTGEVKFMFHAADSGEQYRIDFMYSINAVRLTAKTWMTFWPLELIMGREYSARVRVRGNLLRLDVDGNTVIPGFRFGRTSDGMVGLGTWRGAATFSSLSMRPYEERKCFVIMPFDRDRNFVYEDAIRPAVVDHPDYVIECNRADQEMTTGKITEEIGHLIEEADLLIADITAPNLNVYYELGFGHAVRKKALLLAEDIDGLEVPFDIKDFRHHRYKFTRKGLDELRTRIQQVAANILSS